MAATTLERVKEVFKEIIGIEITEQTTLRSLGLDQLDLVDLINGLEEEFKIQIDDEIAEKFKTVGEIVKHVGNRVPDIEKGV